MSEERSHHRSANAPVGRHASWAQATGPRDRSRCRHRHSYQGAAGAHTPIWKVVAGRREAIGLLEEQSAHAGAGSDPAAVLAHERQPAFTFYRGTALIMTNDLASTPVTGIPVQCVGDAHIGNFGIFRSPCARLVFDINDFDETAIGPVGMGREAARGVGGESAGGRTASRRRTVAPPRSHAACTRTAHA